MALQGKGCIRLQGGTDELGTIAARVLSVLITHVHVINMFLAFVARHRLIDRHDVCGRDVVNVLF